MRKIVLSFVFISVSAFCVFSSPQQRKKENWILLDYMLRGTVPFQFEKNGVEIELAKWNSEILVSLTGNYTASDSLELDQAMKAFDEVLPNLSIDWAMQKRPSLFVVFNKLPYNNNLHHFNAYRNRASSKATNINYNFKIKEAFEGILFINDTISGNQRNNNIWSGFGKVLIGRESFGLLPGKETVLGGKINQLTPFDQFLFTTVYADNFTYQYLKFIKDQYSLVDQYRFLADQDTKYSITLTVTLILILLLTYYFYQFLWVRYLDKKTNGPFARFQLSGFIFFLPQLIVSSFGISSQVLKLQHFPKTVLFYIIGGIISFLFLLFIYFICALAVYFIEIVLFGKIRKFKQRQVIRIFSVSLLMGCSIFFNLSFDHPKVLMGINIFQIFISFLLIILIRFLYFHDQHQKGIIRNNQQLKINRLEQLQTKFQLDAIQARTNPHFLYNSLNTIASLAKQDAGRTEEFALKLSKLLRSRLSEKAIHEVPLSEEIETIKLYLEIEKERFFDRLDYSIQIPENSEALKIPSDILLHLVENSIKHGISKQTGIGIIKIEVSADDHQLHLRVFDNGPDFPDSPIYGTGLKSILEKLNILYPDQYEFAIFNHPNKHVEIVLKRKR